MKTYIKVDIILGTVAFLQSSDRVKFGPPVKQEL
jgi:hypothetical protein